jgi:hypothetical protein
MLERPNGSLRPLGTKKFGFIGLICGEEWGFATWIYHDLSGVKWGLFAKLSWEAFSTNQKR